MLLLRLLWETLLEWQQDNATRQGAALAFYALFACAPLLLVATAVASAFVGEQTAGEQLGVQLRVLATDELAQTIQALMQNSATHRSSGLAAGTLGVVTTLVAGANGMFQLQSTLNLIWGVRANKRGSVIEVVRSHLLAFASVITCGLLLLASVLGTMALRTLAQRAAETLPAHWALLRASQELGGFLLAMLLISIVFKTLSDARPSWRDVLVGAAVSSALFLLGKHGIAWYLREVSASSVFGAAGAVIAVLIYAYYTAQVLLFGAEFSFVLARHLGEPIGPGPNAIRVERTFHQA